MADVTLPEGRRDELPNKNRKRYEFYPLNFRILGETTYGGPAVADGKVYLSLAYADEEAIANYEAFKTCRIS